ncbi:Testis-specific serine/threonine-protein kinase 4 [Sarcoptes scabiei]|uniref:Testis-specific serine/threonine-protein kinase 4 n=1 Tax=Sarcoptes scabiei TaxID=52283 RepID=A0A834RER2_SARSC|nr:Testis-specific serine/threonine-protein kinase 4 [Sarcoptes scabiei]UXI22611.1 zinc finger protein [Sarcoptes scabiei]
MSRKGMKPNVANTQQQPQQEVNRAENGKIDIDPKTAAVFKRKNYHILNKLGAGAFGTVYKAERINVKNELAAVKVLDLTKMSSNYRSKFLPRELQALIETKHENIVDVFDIIRSNKKIYIFMEFMGGGDIAGYVRTNNGVSLKLACIWFLQITNGLMHLHEQLFMCHRDIKLDNMLLSDANIAKLSDFGFARTSFDSSLGKVLMSNTFCGTLPYYCPQLLQKTPYDPFKADVWAMGVSLFILFENRFPFHYKDKKRMLEEAQNYPDYLRSRFSSTLPSKAKKLVEMMLNPNEKDRASMLEIQQNKWLNRFGSNQST